MIAKIILYWLSAYGISFMLVYTTGPFRIFSRIRNIADRNSPMLSELLSCMFCTPTWVGLISSVINVLFLPSIPFTPAYILINDIELWPLIIMIDMLSTASIVHLMDVTETFIDSHGK
jgi:hypothetical protein